MTRTFVIRLRLVSRSAVVGLGVALFLSALSPTSTLLRPIKAAAAAAPAPASASAQTYTERQITSEQAPNSAQDPIVKNGWVAWTRFTPTGSDIFVYNIASKATTQVTSDGTAKLAEIDGQTLVYSDQVTGGYHNILAYDLLSRTTTQLSHDSSNQFHSSISGNLVVWDDDRGFSANPSTATDIWGKLLSGGSEFAVTTDPGIQEIPSISGTLVAWQDLQSTPSVYAANLTCSGPSCAPGPKIAVSTSVESLNPQVDSGRIVYAKMTDTVNRFHNIFIWDAVNGERQVSSCACDQRFPAIGGNLVVWEDSRNQATTGWDLYGHDLTSLLGPDIAIDTQPLDQSLHDTDGTNVVFSDPRTGTENVFLLLQNLDLPLTITSSGAAACGLGAGAGVTFTDADPNGQLAQYSGRIDWGDGTVPSSAVMVINPWGGFAAGGIHAYTAAGTYSITISVNDIEGASAGKTTTLTVSSWSCGD